MNIKKAWITTGLLVTGLLCTFAAPQADTEGASAGKWTMDFEAARKLAAEKEMPILLNFSGSDWCGWCQLMETNVFSQAEWSDYAKSNLVMVLIDFPQDKSLVPEEYTARNEALQAQFDIEGFPTFVVLDSDGTNVLGRLQAGQRKTPAIFQKELSVLLRNSTTEIKKYIASLSPEARIKYKELTDKIAAKKTAIKKEEESLKATERKIEGMYEAVGNLQMELQEFRVAQLSELEQKEYAGLKALFEAKRDELTKWIQTAPQPSEENQAKFEEMQGDLQEIGTKLQNY